LSHLSGSTNSGIISSGTPTSTKISPYFFHPSGNFKSGLAISCFNLSAAAAIGMPVQWKAKGNKVFFPYILSNLVLNSHFDIEYP